MFPFRYWREATMPGLPRSLRNQFMLGLAALSLLLVAIGMAAIYALRNTSDASQSLSDLQLQQMQQAQVIVQRALDIEREAERLLVQRSPEPMQRSQALLQERSRQLDLLIDGIAPSSDDPHTGELRKAIRDLRAWAAHQLLQRRTVQPGEGATSSSGEPDSSGNSAAQALVSSAQQHAAHLEESYRESLRGLVDLSVGNQRGIVLLLSISLVFTWLVASLFLGRHLLQRLQRVSRQLRRGDASSTQLADLVHGEDEIAEMARAVELLLADREQLELRTAELGFAKETLTEQGRILEMIAARAPLKAVLTRLVRLAESQIDGAIGTILLLDADGQRLRHGAAPGLPASYVEAVDGWPVGPASGTCGTAIFRREVVVTSDIQTDPLWEGDYPQAMAARHSLRACWSTPVIAHDGTVLGTFAMYFRAVRKPEARDQRCVDAAVRIAAIAIERRRAEQRIRHMAHHDALTSLPNRALLNDRMAQALAQARRTGRPLAMLFIDLDGFKHINDSLGHGVGDRLLKAVAVLLLTLVREGDTVARLGGDEFVVMLVDLDRPEDAATVAQDIVRALAKPLQTEEHTLHVTASVGISTYPADGDTAEALLRHADSAMYRSKAQGRNSFQCFTPEMGQQARQRSELLNALRQALVANEFELHYQPQVETVSGRIVSVEALIRWRHPQLGMVSPERFIPLAEETGLIAPIGEWVLREACRQLQRWRTAGHTALAMAVNLSARQFEAQDLPALVRQVLQETGLPAACLELELTETALMHNAELMRSSLLQLKDIGVDLALDDFGTGYSSLSHLRRFPIDTIKIDRSFITDVVSSEENSSIVRAIVVMARSLGVITVAEGVENAEQLRFLTSLACQRLQGYYLGRPVPAAELEGLLPVASGLLTA